MEKAFMARVFKSDDGYVGEIREVKDGPVWGDPLWTSRTYETARSAWTSVEKSFVAVVEKALARARVAKP